MSSDIHQHFELREKEQIDDYNGTELRMETNEPLPLDNVIFGEIQVLLAEKRTALSSLRTGIAVFALPLSVLSVLIATSRSTASLR